MKQLFSSELKSKLLRFADKYKYILLLVILGVLLLILPIGSSEKEKAADISPVAEYSLSEIEKELERTIGFIRGAGRTVVMLTLKEGSETVYQQDSKENKIEEEYEKDTVICSSGSGSNYPVISRTVYPIYRGAVVVCEGGGSAGVRLSIVEAVSALTGLSSDKITVLQMK